MIIEFQMKIKPAGKVESQASNLISYFFVCTFYFEILSSSKYNLILPAVSILAPHTTQGATENEGLVHLFSAWLK